MQGFKLVIVGSELLFRSVLGSFFMLDSSYVKM
jgi:hypothetical protein